MKKQHILLLGTVLCLAACQKEEGWPTPEKGQSYTLEGTVATDGFAWETSSSVGIYALTEGVIGANLECKIDGWMNAAERDSSWFVPSQYEGKPTARFATPALDLVPGPNRLFIYSPYDENLSFVKSLNVIYNLEVSDKQTQTSPDVAGGCFAYGISEAVPGKDEMFQFTLNPVTALLKISISSSEFKDYGVKKVTLFDEAGEAQLGGTFDINIEDKNVSPIKTVSKIATTISATRPMGGASQSIYMNILPGDYSSKDLTFIVELTGDKGNVTIPMKHKGVKCEAGKTAELSISELKSGDNIYKWFCPVESRQLSGLGYAYGDANTYFIQCKNGSTYKGAAYSPNAEYPESVTIDYRLRGNPAAEAPEGVTFEWATLANGTVYAPRKAGYEASGVVPENFTFTQDAANYTVTVTNTGAFAGAPILLMKKGEKILWGWSFWNIAADGTAVKPVDIGGSKVANLAIGQATADYDKWIANKSGSNPDPIFRTIHYYQWGRFLPIFWNSFWSLSWIYSAQQQEAMSGDGNVPAISGPFATLQESMEHPYGLVCHNATDRMNKWCKEEHDNLWGGVIGNEGLEKPGTKSIYDPCPKGWRVPDISVIQAWADVIGDVTTAKYEETFGKVGIYAGSEEIAYMGWIDPNVSSNGRPTNYGNGNNGKWTSGFSLYWSNYLASMDADSPFVFRFYGSNNKNSKLSNPGQSIRVAAAPVRCMVDDDKR